jgi:hypothetical protein
VCASGKAKQLDQPLSTPLAPSVWYVDQPKRFTTLFECRKPGFMNAVVCSCAPVKAKVFGDCASQGYLAVGIDAHRRAWQSTGSMIAGGVWCGLPGEVLKPTYETFIHIQN